MWWWLPPCWAVPWTIIFIHLYIMGYGVSLMLTPPASSFFSHHVYYWCLLLLLYSTLHPAPSTTTFLLLSLLPSPSAFWLLLLLWLCWLWWLTRQIMLICYSSLLHLIQTQYMLPATSSFGGFQSQWYYSYMLPVATNLWWWWVLVIRIETLTNYQILPAKSCCKSWSQWQRDSSSSHNMMVLLAAATATTTTNRKLIVPFHNDETPDSCHIMLPPPHNRCADSHYYDILSFRMSTRSNLTSSRTPQKKNSDVQALR